MLDSLLQSLAISVAVFCGAACVVGFAGVRMSALADRLADRTGLGEAVFGAIFLASATSLPDFAATLTAAVQGRAELAVSNITGSLAVNIVFLAIGDAIYRRANLEHAAASPANLSQSALLIALLTLPLLAMVGPKVELWSVHPLTIVILLAYPYGYWLVRRTHEEPMWEATQTRQTVVDKPDVADASGESLRSLWLQFLLIAVVIAIAGWALMQSARAISDQSALTDSVVGALLTGVFTSLPELVTTIAAIKRGALTLAVGNIVGTNCFNVLVIATADIAYREGSIYHAVTSTQILWVLLSVLMTAILLLGLVRRQLYGFARIGFESVSILLLWLGAATLSLLYQ